MGNHDQPSRELHRRTLAAGKFLTLAAIHWRDAHGSERVWETADRNGGNRAVMLIAWLKPSQRLVLIRQYRPPARGFVIEFPAGIMGDGEQIEEASLRELHEETGYTGQVVSILSPGYNTPGLSNDAAHVVVLEINEHAEMNANAQPHLQDDEELEVVLVERAKLLEWLNEQQQRGEQFDIKVAAYIVGISG